MSDDEHLEWFEERAAILEFDGGLCRDQAQRLAYWEWRSMVGPEVVAPQQIMAWALEFRGAKDAAQHCY